MKKLIFILLLISIPQMVLGDSFVDKFKDPMDGAIDTSEWLGGRTGFLPVPILITEPAVGVGLGAALLFFHDSGEKKDAPPETQDEFGLPPSVSVLAGGYTENDSWFVGGGHMGSWKEDSIRYQGLIGMADLNLKFYGIGEGSSLPDNGLEFNIEGQFLLQELKFRIKESDFFLGARYTFLNMRPSSNCLRISPIYPPSSWSQSQPDLGSLQTMTAGTI